MAIYGYARVSSKTQNSDRQIAALKEYVEERKIFIDYASGKDFERTGFENLIKALDKGDVLYIKEIDRLGRTKEQTKKWLDYFNKEGIVLRILDLPTTMKDFGDDKQTALIQNMINNILLEVFTTLAEKERITIRERQREGIAIAKSKGKYKGGTRKNFINDEFIKTYEMWKRKEITGVEASKRVHMKRPTFYRLAKEYETEIKAKN